MTSVFLIAFILYQIIAGGTRRRHVVDGNVIWEVEGGGAVSRQNDNVTLTCVVDDVAFFDVVRVTLRPRSVIVPLVLLASSTATGPLHDAGAPSHAADVDVVDGPSSPISWIVADNGQKKPEFAELERYRVDYRVNENRAVVRLNIVGMNRFNNVVGL